MSIASFTGSFGLGGFTTLSGWIASQSGGGAGGGGSGAIDWRYRFQCN